MAPDYGSRLDYARIVVAFLAIINVTVGELRFASYYGDHMVLQKAPERAVVWGYGPAGAPVTVALSGPSAHKTQVLTTTKGIWRVTFDPVEAGGPYKITAALQEETGVTLSDVLFGDIWLCGGQSNMAFAMRQIFNASEELDKSANYTQVRFFMAAPVESKTEQADLAKVEIHWSAPTSKELANFSAVCWLFGRYLYETLRYPVGLVESCWGGTPVEVWSSSRALRHCGLGVTENSTAKIQTGNREAESGERRAGERDAWNGTRTGTPAQGPKENSILWNAMIHPLLNMTIKGAIWYQGEANTLYHQDKYNCSFPAMIDDWRMSFHLGSGGQTDVDFPFGFVQLSTDKKGSSDEGFPNIRWHQTADVGFVPNQRMKRTFMAVALDLPDERSPYGSIHPRDKQDVAHRLTLGARAVAYGEKGVSFLGPFPQELLITRSYLNVTYDQKISVAASNHIFEIQCMLSSRVWGPESNWLPAPIVTWNTTVVQLSNLCHSGEQVVGLRYAWRDWPCEFKACPIYSSTGLLPAAPFRASHPGGQP